MPAPLSTLEARGAAAASPTSSYRPALALLASLFFMWGFITVINNTLLPHLRAVFDLDDTQTTLPSASPTPARCSCPRCSSPPCWSRSRW